MAGIGMKDIRRRIKSVQSTMQITNAMELVASSKLRRAKQQVESNKPYFQILYEAMQRIAQSAKSLRSVYTRLSEEQKRGYIVIAGDRGLAAGYNANVLKMAKEHMRETAPKQVVAVGRKAVDYFKRHHPDQLVGQHSSDASDLDIAKIRAISRPLLEAYQKQEINELWLIYTRFISPLVQEPQKIRLLPLEFTPKEESVQLELTVYDPSPEEVFDELVPKYIDGLVMGAVMEAYASEMGARRTAMEAATDNAQEMIEGLELKFNRARQAAITQEISEIVAGANALS